MRHPYGEDLTIDRVIELAVEAAARLEIRIPEQPTLREMISEPEPMPAIFRQGSVTLWIDRFYIAFAHEDASLIQYLYLTRQHIIEERIAILRLKRQRGTNMQLSEPLHWQFSAAWRAMNRSDKAYALRPFPWPQGCSPDLDLKALVACLTCWASVP